MAKGRKKKNNKLRRQLRKTFGALLMATSIIVAAIPVQEMEAKIGEVATKVTVLNQTKGLEEWEDAPAGLTGTAYKSNVPYISPYKDAANVGETVYTTGDGRFHFAYVNPTKTNPTKIAVIVGYTNIGSLENNALIIPDTVDAYRKYSTNTTVGEACAVNKQNKFLFYKIEKMVQKVEGGKPMYETTDVTMLSSVYNANPSVGEVINGGNPAVDISVTVRITDTSKPIMEKQTTYEPCYFSTRESWDKNALGDKVFGEDELFYIAETNADGTPKRYEQTILEQDQRIHDALVAYIGNQRVVANPDAASQVEWVVSAYTNKPEDGIFAGNKNIVSLTLGDNLMGVGAYAFYNCTGLGNVNLNNGLNTIANGAFAECRNLMTCNIDPTANLGAIGKDAFYNCVGLTEIVIPTGLEGIGDSAFENCRSMKKVDFGTDKNPSLNTLGDKAFNGCETLEKIEFPRDYEEAISVNLFDGCTNLKYIKAPNNILSFADVEADIKDFIRQVPEEFYFESGDSSPIHTLTKKYGIAFKYLGQDIFEKVVIAYDEDGNETGRTIWKVNSNNELIEFGQTGTVNNLEVPSKIGPYGILKIADNSFADNCALKKIIIPSSVTEIGNQAFMGCHNLKDVIFQEPISLTSIGTDAFATQKTAVHMTGCDGQISATPSLSFTGKIANDSLPYKYAMTPSSTINYGTQPKTWITFYSGWPSNLTVQYNPATDKNELLDYPLYEELKNYNLNSYPYMTPEYVSEAATAVSVYEAYQGDNTKPKPTEYQEQIVNSALNLVLPSGIEAIKPGIFSGKDENGAAAAGLTPNTRVKSITTNTVEKLPTYGFADCTGLESFYMGGGTEVGDYTFDSCTGLRTVEIAPSVTTLGKRPFSGCITANGTEGLTSVSFPGSEYFTCQEGIIFGKTGGANTKIVECLETRGKIIGSSMAGPEEFASVKEIAPEAFMDCDGIGEVNLDSSTIQNVPEKCFAETGNLFKVTLPDTAKDINKGAFWNSSLGNIVIPESVVRIAPNAFSNTPDDGASFDDTTHKKVTVICKNDSPAAYYAKDYPYMETKEDPDMKTKWTVMYFDSVDELKPVPIDEKRVVHGEDAPLPTPPVHEGYTFSYWFPVDAYKNITRNLELYARYQKDEIKVNEYTVVFIDWDDKVLATRIVKEGEDAEAPAEPKRDGYVFKNWLPSDFTKVKENMKVYAQYDVKDETKYIVSFYDEDGTTLIGPRQQIKPGDDAIEPAHPTKEGYTFEKWIPENGWKKVTKDVDIFAQYTKGSGGGDDPGGDDPGGDDPGGDDPGNNGGNNGNNGGNGSGSSSGSSSSGNSVSDNSAKYKVVVNGGSGSGDYKAGTIVNINAYATADGRVFDKWISSSFGVGFVDAKAISTTFTMPGNNVEITANFKTKDSDSVSSNARNTRNTLRNETSSVDITKSGISNKDLASANVNGTSDNYIVKITEDAQATAAVIQALEARYGDLSNIAYLPMDISLYESTGQTKIENVNGVSVDITLPLPDELVQYAGNNKAASVVNSQLEDLNAKFTSIDGVPCVQFRATHFSPYVIYVDKANLTEGTIDATPKTGDPIHPKWFLAIGLACISVILFCKKDKGQPKVKAA